MSKFGVGGIVAANFNTLRDVNTGRRRPADWVQLLGIPLAGGAAVQRLGFNLQGIGELLAGVAILSGLLFGLVIFVFQVRLDMSHDPRVAPRGLVAQLIDELFANVTYAVLVGLATTGVAVAAAATRVPLPGGDLAPLSTWWTAALTALLLHLLLMILMCLKRMHSAYGKLIIQRSAPLPADTAPTGAGRSPE